MWLLYFPYMSTAGGTPLLHQHFASKASKTELLQSPLYRKSTERGGPICVIWGLKACFRERREERVTGRAGPICVIWGLIGCLSRGEERRE
jgi:hypothetical protein